MNRAEQRLSVPQAPRIRWPEWLLFPRVAGVASLPTSSRICAVALLSTSRSTKQRGRRRMTVTHAVLFKVKDSFDGAAASKGAQELLGSIPGVQSVR